MISIMGKEVPSWIRLTASAASEPIAISAEMIKAAADPVLLSVVFMARVGTTANIGPSANRRTATARVRVTGVSQPEASMASNNREPHTAQITPARSISLAPWRPLMRAASRLPII